MRGLLLSSMLVFVLIACAQTTDPAIEEFYELFPNAEQTSERYTQEDADLVEEFLSAECNATTPFTREVHKQYNARLVKYERDGETLCLESRIRPGELSVEEGVDGPAGVAFIVNDDPINLTTLQAQYEQLPEEEQTTQNLNLIANQLITQTLLEQATSEYEADQEAEYQRFLEESNLSEQEARAQIGSLEDFKAQLAAQARVRALLEDQYGPYEPDEERVREFYMDSLDAFITNERATFQQVYINASQEGAQARLQEAIQTLNETEDFCTAVAQHADALQEDCGTTRDVTRGVLYPQLEQTVFTAQPGVVETVQTPLGLHLVNVIERQGPSVARYDDARGEAHTLLTSRVEQLRLDAYLEWLKDRASVTSYLTQS